MNIERKILIALGIGAGLFGIYQLTKKPKSKKTQTLTPAETLIPADTVKKAESQVKKVEETTKKITDIFKPKITKTDMGIFAHKDNIPVLNNYFKVVGTAKKSDCIGTTTGYLWKNPPFSKANMYNRKYVQVQGFSKDGGYITLIVAKKDVDILTNEDAAIKYPDYDLLKIDPNLSNIYETEEESIIL